MGAESWKDPDNDGLDDWRPKSEDDGPPGYTMPPKRGWPWAFPMTSSIECPKCAAANAIRKGVHTDIYVPENAPLEPWLMSFTYRSRDAALWCHTHDEFTIRCSEDTILRALLRPDTEG